MQAQAENVLALMSLLGTPEEEVVAKLTAKVTITVGETVGARLLANDMTALLERSLSLVDNGALDIEVAIGASFKTDAPVRLHVALTTETITVGADVEDAAIADDVPGLFRKIGACYAAGNVIARAIGGEMFEHLPEPFIVNFRAFGVTVEDVKRRIRLDDAVLVGAGGVGNGFMWAASELDLEGNLTIADPKATSPGGLNRCLYFREGDEGPKATTLAERTDRPGFRVDGFVGEFSELVKQRGRVRKVITTPDSRVTRRSIQGELPLEVLDASTTDLSEVVVHSHRQPTEGACLACIYIHIPVEDQRRQHIAEGLGLTFEEVGRGLIDAEIAKKLAAIHPGLPEADVIGRAFDTVYKEQCGKGALKTAAGQQAVAPLAFISNLAGALLALELARFERPGAQPGSSYMTLSPWRPPSLHARRAPGRKVGCEFCGTDNGPESLREVWSDVLG
jgi:molybdopterin/thiamine biosynthesis adenylyltransferase